jgi:hypothetical protein
LRVSNMYHIPAGDYCTPEVGDCDMLTCTTNMEEHFVCDLFKELINWAEDNSDNTGKCKRCKEQFPLGARVRETYDVIENKEVPHAAS